jgi:hypothetical protein
MLRDVQCLLERMTDEAQEGAMLMLQGLAKSYPRARAPGLRLVASRDQFDDPWETA